MSTTGRTAVGGGIDTSAYLSASRQDWRRTQRGQSSHRIASRHSHAIFRKMASCRTDSSRLRRTSASRALPAGCLRRHCAEAQRRIAAQVRRGAAGAAVAARR
eukprot:scaffold1130_cov74-Phaeocystis_antarctica.AAC.7